MRILNVNHTLDPVTGGGTAERTLQMSRHFIGGGIKCTVLTTDLGEHPERIPAPVRGSVVTLPLLLRRFYVPRCSLRQIEKIVANADVIHLMGHWTLLNALVYLAARKLGKPYVFCPAGALPVFGRSKMLKIIYNWTIGKAIVEHAAKCIAITEDEKAQFHRYGVADDKIVVLPNGVNEEEFTFRDDAGFRKKFGLSERPFILFVGRLNLIKGPDLLLRAFCQIKEEFPSCDLVIVGPDGGMLDMLKKIVLQCAAEQRVHFLGYLAGMEKSWAYHAATLLVIPSRQEAMSIVVLEAGISGTPSLFTDRCGLDEIANCGYGWMVPPSVEGLKKGLQDILSSPAKLKTTKINEYVLANYSWSVVIERYRGLYQELLGQK